MADLDTLRPEVQEAMHRLENYLHITIDGKHFRSEDYDTIRAELLRLANENFMLNRINVAPFKQELDGERMHVAALTARCQRAEAELAEAQNTIAAQQGTMGALKRKLALSEGDLAALKARIAEAPSTQVSRMAAIGGGSYEWAGCRVPDEWNGKRVRLVAEE